MHKIVRFEQIAAYPDSTRKVGTVIEIDTNEPKEDSKWIDSYISFFESYPYIFKRLENVHR